MKNIFLILLCFWFLFANAQESLPQASTAKLIGSWVNISISTKIAGQEAEYIDTLKFLESGSYGWNSRHMKEVGQWNYVDSTKRIVLTNRIGEYSVNHPNKYSSKAVSIKILAFQDYSMATTTYSESASPVHALYKKLK